MVDGAETWLKRGRGRRLSADRNGPSKCSSRAQLTTERALRRLSTNDSWNQSVGLLIELLIEVLNEVLVALETLLDFLELILECRIDLLEVSRLDGVEFNLLLHLSHLLDEIVNRLLFLLDNLLLLHHHRAL